MRNFIFFIGLVSWSAGLNQALAYLPIAAITTANMYLYGLYTTADPSCMTGLVATLPLSATAKTINMASAVTLGNGVLATSVNCVIAVVRNYSGPYTWSAASATLVFSGTSGTSLFSDNISACTNGGTVAANTSYNNGATVVWPTQIRTDALAVGLNLLLTVPNGTATGNEVFPIYHSVNSGCVGSAIADASTSGCVVNGVSTVNPLSPPIVVNDTSNGLLLTAPAASGYTYRFYFDFSSSLGATSASTCGLVTPPLQGFEKIL